MGLMDLLLYGPKCHLPFMAVSVSIKPMEKNDIKHENNENELTVYEVGYLLSPQISEENVQHEVAGIINTVKNHGGIEIGNEEPLLIDLAYEMVKIINHKKNKFTSAYFGWVKFEAEPAKVISIKDELDGNAQIIRFIIVKTIRENTVSVRKTLSKAAESSKKRSDDVAVSEGEAVEAEAPKEVDVAVLDKTIDELIVE